MKTTKKLLFATLCSLMISIALLIGTTVAWFSASIINNENKIQSGTLDVELYQKEDTLNDKQIEELENSGITIGDYVNISNTESKIFDCNVWEPGYFDIVTFKVRNNGSLSLKYEFFFDNIVSDKLINVLDLYIVSGTYENQILEEPDYALADLVNTQVNFLEGELNPGETSEAITLIIKMRESADNSYQGISATFDVKLRAIQTNTNF